MAGRSKKDRGIVDDGLSEEAIVRAARKLIEESGVDGLTMRRLSDALGVALGATYHYVPNRRSLVILVAQDIYCDLELPDVTRGEWSDHVFTAIVRFVHLLNRYPGMTGEVARDQRSMAPRELEVFVRDRLAVAGFGATDVGVVLASLFFYVSGATVVVQSLTAADADAANEHFEAGLRLLLSGAAASAG